MNKYIVLYHAPTDMMKQAAEVSPEERAKSMEAWMKWAENCGSGLVDMGAPLMGGLQLSPDGSSANSDKNVAGFSVLQAESMDDAKKLLVGHPHLAWNADCSIEVHETVQMPGM